MQLGGTVPVHEIMIPLTTHLYRSAAEVYIRRGIQY
jgi:hypothetical protein